MRKVKTGEVRVGTQTHNNWIDSLREVPVNLCEPCRGSLCKNVATTKIWTDAEIIEMFDHSMTELIKRKKLCSNCRKLSGNLRGGNFYFCFSLRKYKHLNLNLNLAKFEMLVHFLKNLISLGVCRKCDNITKNLLNYASPNNPFLPFSERTPNSKTRWKKRKEKKLEEKKKKSAEKKENRGTNFLKLNL